MELIAKDAVVCQLYRACLLGEISQSEFSKAKEICGRVVSVDRILGGEITRAVEKQKPKKPTNVRVGEYLGDIEYAECPVCGDPFPDINGVSEPDGEIDKLNYCPTCGQKIDWT